MWPSALKYGWKFKTMSLNEQGTGPEESTDACATSIQPTGNALQTVLFNDIHKSSSAWVKRIGGAHGYVFGWDWRKGPDRTLSRLDKFVDFVRSQHGASKIAVIAHSYGGILARWYIDDPARAKKVARVANFGTPFWGAPKAWFAIAYGYETPKDEKSDMIVYNGAFKHWTKNLTGMYYLLPPQAWFNGMPGALSPWLEMNEKPVTNASAAATWIGSDSAADGNERLARDVFENHRVHVDGFKTYDGAVDWRIFVGSGLASMGHVRAYTSKDIDPQYSWFNGDSTVPLVSQRQSATATGRQLGDQVKTYNFCNIKHMDEMETQPVQDAVTPFIVSGADPIVDGEVLRNQPCRLAASEYRVTGEEDEKSQWITVESEVKASAASGAHAASARMTLEQASAAGLIQLARTPHGLTFVTTTDKPLTYEAAGTGTVTVTPLTGDAQKGPARVYELSAKPIAITSRGAASASAAKSRPADTTGPKTTAAIKRGKLRVRARDASGVAATFFQVGRRAPKIYRRALKVTRTGRIRVWSVDRAGNTERKRVVKR
jgi:pimeloyl-ACP methyl ester carboxylesterase